MVPLLKAQQHVRPDDEEELGVRVLPAQLGDGIKSIASPAAAQFDVADLPSRDLRESHAAQFHALFGARAVLGEGLVRRNCGGNDQETVGREGARDGLRRLDVSQMRRVEAASVDGDPHAFFLSFGSSIFGSCALRR